MTLGACIRAGAPHGLDVMGALHPSPKDTTEGIATIVLLGMNAKAWPIFTQSAEYGDGMADPLDRWSKRVVGAIATRLGATTAFPSDGPPYPPFVTWALQSGRFHHSPIGMLVHDQAGLMISLRGALLFNTEFAVDAPTPSPCIGCDAPCKTACPVAAFGPDGYDVAACKSHLATDTEPLCMKRGCVARRHCPVSRSHGRVEAQSAFHMRSFFPS